MTPWVRPLFDAEQGLIELPGAPVRWIWAFTCPTPSCDCRVALVLSAPGERETLLERGRPVAHAWHGKTGRYAQALQDAPGITAFSIHLDTHALYPPVGDEPLDPAAHPEVREIAERIDDDVLDVIAQVWYLGKGREPPPEPGAGGVKIMIEGWRPGELVLWDDVQPALRGDTYVFGERTFEAFELYCVKPDCDCGHVVVEFSPVLPRRAPVPGHVDIHGDQVTLHPSHEHQRARLNELWTAYCQRHPRHRERWARRSEAMRGLAGRIVAAPPKRKVGRNEPCPCGSGKKFKKCCGNA